MSDDPNAAATWHTNDVPPTGSLALLDVEVDDSYAPYQMTIVARWSINPEHEMNPSWHPTHAMPCERWSVKKWFGPIQDWSALTR